MNTAAKLITGTITVFMCIAIALEWQDRSARKNDELTRGY